MEITEIRIALRDDNKLKAFASITLDNCFVTQSKETRWNLSGYRPSD